MERLPREVPEGLTAPEYYKLASEYKKMGWIEQARDASTLAIELGGTSDTAKAARVFLKTKIPKLPVPLLAEQRFIEGFNQMAVGETSSAMTIFEELVRDYPDFEWGYGQLSVLHLQEGDHQKAKELLKVALEINPDYVNAWLHMATASVLESDFSSAIKYVDRALSSDPSDPAANAMRDELNKLESD